MHPTSRDVSFREIALMLGRDTLQRLVVPSGFLIRDWQTDYRGPICLTGAGFAWATAQLVACDDSYAPGHYLWRFNEFAWLDEPIPYDCARWPAFENDGRLAPVFCSATLQEQLHRALTAVNEPLPLVEELDPIGAAIFPPCKEPPYRVLPGPAQQLSLW